METIHAYATPPDGYHECGYVQRQQPVTLDLYTTLTTLSWLVSCVDEKYKSRCVPNPQNN